MQSNESLPRRRRAWLLAATAATSAGLLAVTAAAYAADSSPAAPGIAAPAAVGAPAGRLHDDLERRLHRRRPAPA